MLEVKIKIRSDYAVVVRRHLVPDIVSCIRSLSAQKTLFCLRWLLFSLAATRGQLPWRSRQQAGLIFSHLYVVFRVRW